MLKKEARNYFLQKRLLLTNSEVETASFQAFTRWKNSDLIHLDSFHIFLSIKEKKEVNTQFFLDFLWENNKTVYSSKVEGKSLLHYELTPHTILGKNSWGILEPVNPEFVIPERIDCVFVPLLAYDLQGNRAGYGKGYYDRFLCDYPETKKVGLSFFDSVSNIEDISISDVPLDYIITPGYFSGFPMAEK